MIYLVNGKKIDIPIEEEPYGKGSEGKIYKKGKFAYKIYYPNMINEGHGSKENFHQYLLNIPTKQIILPDQTIYTEEGKYQGYRAPLIPGKRRKNTGISQISSQEFIKNLKILEDDFDLLTDNYILTADVSPVNYIFNKQKNTMYIIDPGRYRHHCLLGKESYHIQNSKQLEVLIEQLLYNDFMEYKPLNSKNKLLELRQYLKDIKRKEACRYSEFFEKKLKGFDNVEEYVKSLGRYIK